MPAGDAAHLARAVRIAQRHGLDTAAVTRYDSGSLPVFALGGDLVLKLYPSEDAAHAKVEARVLAFVDGRLPLRTPAVLATGHIDDGHYLLMSQLPGRRLVEAWPEMPAADRGDVAEQLGRAVAAMHALDAAALSDLPPPHWAEFMATQRASAVERQRARGLADAWLQQIDAFIARWAAPVGPQRVLLHTEIMREHLLVEPAGGHWRLSGLIDFEPAMLGERDYEFASIGLFVSCGDARTLRRVLQACGLHPSQFDTAMSCRLMAQALLHRYSNLRWYLERLPCPGAATLEQLARHWWALEDAA